MSIHWDASPLTLRVIKYDIEDTIWSWDFLKKEKEKRKSIQLVQLSSLIKIIYNTEGIHKDGRIVM